MLAGAGKRGVKAMGGGGAYLSVLGVGDEPVDRGEVLPLRQLLVQPPENLQKKTEGKDQLLNTETCVTCPVKRNTWNLGLKGGLHKTL